MALPRRRVFQAHMMDYPLCTFQPEESLSPEQADWMRTLRPEKTLTDALRRCAEMTGQCPVAYFQGKGAEILDCSLAKLTGQCCANEEQKGANGKDQRENVVSQEPKKNKGEDETDLCQKAVAATEAATVAIQEKLNYQTCLDFCFDTTCKTCSLLHQDSEKVQLIVVDFWSTESKAVGLGYLPPTFEVADVKHLIGRKLNRSFQDLVLLYDEEPTKDLHLLRDLAEDGSLFFKVWEEMDEGAVSVRDLKVQYKDISERKHVVEESRKMALEAKKEERERMQSSADNKLKMLEAERVADIGKINRRYDKLIEQEKRKLLEVSKVLDKQVLELEDQLEQVEQTGNDNAKMLNMQFQELKDQLAQVAQAGNERTEVLNKQVKELKDQLVAATEMPNLDQWMAEKCDRCHAALHFGAVVYICNMGKTHCMNCQKIYCGDSFHACSTRYENKWAGQLLTMAKEATGRRNAFVTKKLHEDQSSLFKLPSDFPKFK